MWYVLFSGIGVVIVMVVVGVLGIVDLLVGGCVILVVVVFVLCLIMMLIVNRLVNSNIVIVLIRIWCGWCLVGFVGVLVVVEKLFRWCVSILVVDCSIELCCWGVGVVGVGVWVDGFL